MSIQPQLRVSGSVQSNSTSRDVAANALPFCSTLPKSIRFTMAVTVGLRAIIDISAIQHNICDMLRASNRMLRSSLLSRSTTNAHQPRSDLPTHHQPLARVNAAAASCRDATKSHHHFCCMPEDHSSVALARPPRLPSPKYQIDRHLCFV